MQIQTEIVQLLTNEMRISIFARLSCVKIEIRVSLVNNSAFWQNRHVTTTNENVKQRKKVAYLVTHNQVVLCVHCDVFFSIPNDRIPEHRD